MVRLKLDQHIEITVRPEIITQGRPKEGQSPDVMATAESGDLLAGNFNIDGCR